MKSFLLILWLIVLSALSAGAQQNWINYKVDNKLSLKLPSQPKQIQEGTVLAMQKDTIVCVVTVVDFLKTSQLDSLTFAQSVPTQAFANEVRKGMLSEMPGFTMDDIRVGKWKGYTTYAMQGEQTTQKLQDFTYMIIIGRFMYSVSALIPQGKSTAPKDYLFNSIVEN